MGGEWTINFRTYGTHNLTISVINGTTFGDSSPDDVGFVGVLCGNDSILDATAHDGIITFEDYQCDGIASLVLSVHTPGIHDIHLSFGVDTAYASNNAYPNSVVEINSSTANGPTLSDVDRFGFSVTPIGDLDGDGVTDLAVGAARDDGGGSDRGAVHIMFMNTDGTVDSTVEINDSTANGPTLSNNDRFGVSVASIGDLDGDGVTDLAVGAARDDGGGRDRGAVHIMFMNTDGTVDSTVEINDSTANGPTLSDVDRFGVSVTPIGDLDGDGVTDLAVGANRDDDGGSDRGAVHIMFMNMDGTVDSTVEINDSTANGPTLSDVDYFGFSVTPIGDLDGDGVTDLAVGAARDDDRGRDRGAVHIMFMNMDGTVDSTVEINDSTANGPTLSDDDNFGASVASIGDLDGDGVTDLAVGAYQDDGDGGSERGAVHIMFMNTDGTINSTVEINDSTTNGPTLSDDDSFGVSVASIGDLDGDGVTDLAVGAYQDDEGGSDRGAVHIIHINGMKTNGNGSVDNTVEINDSTANSPVLSDYDYFGGSVAAIGDLDGDGVTDLAVGAQGDDDGGQNRGTVHVMFMNGNGSVKGTVEINNSTANGPVLSDDDGFGRSVAAIGDLDGDGVQDLAVGANGDDNGGTDHGAVHVMFMNGNGSVKDTVEINNSTANGPVLSNNDFFGTSVAAIGDLDGDGVPDLAAGANGDSNGGEGRGAVHVMFMNGNGTVKGTVEINDSTANGPVLSDEDYFGASVAAIGDLDGDGVQDLVVGAWGNYNGGPGRGAVHVMFMNGNGTVKGTVEINDSTANGPVLSDEDYFGISVAAIGDLDGDGVQDLAVGADGDDNGGTDHGAVHVMFMNRDGSVKDTVEINDSTANGPVLSDDDFFGASVAAIGDLDGDGVPDLAAGAWGDDHGGTDHGTVHVMFMNGNGSVKDTVKINDSTANSPVLSDYDYFGGSVAAIGDLDGDGVTDLAVGAQGDDDGGQNRGTVHVMFMNGNGSVKGTVEINNSTANGPVLSDDDGFGRSVAAIGDLDGDGVQDLAVGANGDDNGGTDHGAVHVMFMNGNGSVKDTVEINNSTANGPVLSNNDFFGTSVAAIGDLDGDGVPDLAAGANGDSNGGEGRGAVHVMFMNGNGTVKGTVEINDSTANGPVLSDEDYFGASVAAIGDLDGDGVQDLVVGAWGNYNGGPGRGAVHVMFMNGNGTVKGTVEINDSTANGPVLSDEDYFGISVAAIGDLDGDGVQDLAVGADGDDNGGTDHGAVHVMFMNRDGSVKDTVEINDSTANGPVLSDDDFFGASVAAIGDLDGDGVPDLAAGAWGDDHGGTDHGTVHVMFMNGNGSVKDTVKINDSTANSPVLSDYDYFGGSVAAIGDLDGDGVTDLAVGAQGDDDGGQNRGTVHVMFMNGNGSVKGTVEINNSTANGPVLSDDDGFGRSVAAIGDLDGDGVQDLAVGANGDDNGGTDHGAVHVMFMNGNGSVKDTVEINNSTANGPVLSNNDFFGTSVAAIGDLDGDGVPDLAAGANGDSNGGEGRGAVHVMFMNGNGTVKGTVEINDSTANGPVLSDEDYFGASVAAIGDLDGDGVQDLVVGAWGNYNGGPGRGAVHVMFMNGNGTVKGTVEINDSTANGPVLSDEDYFGISVAAIGDLDGDGVQDLAVGADGDDNGGTDHGAVHVMFMNRDGSVKDTVEINDSTANGPVLSDDDFFGASVAAIGDLDGDGVPDLAAGAWGDDHGGTDHGTVHIMYFDKDVLIRAVSSTTADGTYGSSQTVDITVKFSEPVAVTGTPRLTLDVSPQHRTAPYLSGSGTDILTFRYAPQSTDVSSDLQYVAQNSLSPDGEMGGQRSLPLRAQAGT